MVFWEFNINAFDIIVLTGILAVVFLLSNVIRRKVGFIRRSLLPTAVIGGILMLVIKSLGLFDQIMNIKDANMFMEAITYHTLGLGVVALTLKSSTINI